MEKVTIAEKFSRINEHWDPRIAGELNGGNALELTLTLPIVIWRMLATLSVDERVMWIVWVWAITVAVRLTSAWRRRRRLRVT